jgi:endoribonuclease Dicer
MIQYIQSRGRARREDSVYIHMLEDKNSDHLRRYFENQRREDAFRQFCQALPEDRKLGSDKCDLERLLSKERHQRKFTVPSTGALLSYSSSLIVLTEFAASLPHEAEVSLIPNYSVMSTAEGFICEVQLPSSSPITAKVGSPHRTKQLAKCAAAFDMCQELLKAGYLKGNLRSSFTKQLPSMRNARLAVSSKKKRQYEMRLKPELWAKLGVPERLFVTVLKLSQPQSMHFKSRPLILLTREDLPNLEPFRLFFAESRASDVELVRIASPIRTNDDMLEELTAFFLRIFQDVFSKEYECFTSDVPYFLAPSRYGHDHAYGKADEPVSLVDWECVRDVKMKASIDFEGDRPNGFFKDKFVVDPYEGSRKFFLHRVRKDLTPLSPVPDGVPQPKGRYWRDVTHDITNYSVTLWKNSRELRKWREDQPVVEAYIPSLRRDLLDERISEEILEPQKCFIILEPLRISTLPADTAAMAYNFPSIIHRLESALIALDACKLLGLEGIEANLALEALTKDSDNSGEHDEEPVNFQGGMGRNYERLELLGDSFLKMATTIAVYTLIPDKDEFEYHVERMCMICNKNLLNNALDYRLEEYVRSKQFTRRGWYPPTVDDAEHAGEQGERTGILQPVDRKPGLVLKRGKKQAEKETHVLGDKSIADVCEAFIGAAYLTGYPHSFDLAVQAVTAVVGNKMHRMKAYSDYYKAYRKPLWQDSPATATQVDLAQKLGAQVGYHFRYPRLARCAFQHPSYPRMYENLPSYQRLEFLGDALFDMAAVDFLFHRFPNKDPQWLTEHKMAMVSNQFLGTLSVALGFHKHLVSMTAALPNQIRDWVGEITNARTQAEEEAVAAGKRREDYARNFWVSVPQPPKCLPDVLEAYIGAAFVDSQYDYGVVQTFFRQHAQPYFEDMAIYDTYANKHPVTFCANLLQLRFSCRDWRVVVSEAPADTDAATARWETQVHAGFMVHGVVVGYGISESGRSAKLAAAKKTLAKLEGMNALDFWKMTGCDCNSSKDAEIDDSEDVHGTAA